VIVSSSASWAYQQCNILQVQVILPKHVVDTAFYAYVALKLAWTFLVVLYWPGFDQLEKNSLIALKPK